MGSPLGSVRRVQSLRGPDTAAADERRGKTQHRHANTHCDVCTQTHGHAKVHRVHSSINSPIGRRLRAGSDGLAAGTVRAAEVTGAAGAAGADGTAPGRTEADGTGRNTCSAHRGAVTWKMSQTPVKPRVLES